MSNIVTVSELSKAISVLFEDKIGYISVQGEISNFKAHSSGHRYFTLKDDNAQISCTMWRHKQIGFQPADGMKVVVRGNLTVYPPRGQYQIECDSMTPLGLGDLHIAFEALKKKLSENGYFDYDRKRKIPELPMIVGVATSPTGAAIKDIFTTMNRRFSACKVLFRPTLVQGDGSAEDIVKAIKELNNTDADVLIVGRGGGSIEDLWCFNTEIVANAIFSSPKPVISAVGHETDFTIADFVADMRAATPTAAAELVTPNTTENLLNFIEFSSNQISKLTTSKINQLRDLVDNQLKNYSFRRFYDKIKTNIKYIDDLEYDLRKSINSNFQVKNQRVNSLISLCNSLSPLAPLNKGYALLESEGRAITNTETLGNFINIDIIRKQERAEVTINRIVRKK